MIKVEIWSDMVCPFCYIGKKNFNEGLNKFEHKSEVEIVWRSFFLNENLNPEKGESLIQNLKSSKQWTDLETKEALDYTTKMAANSGLEFNFEKGIAANSRKAHEFAHFAAGRGYKEEAYEAIFSAYFTEGKDIDDTDTLLEISNRLGLKEEETIYSLEKKLFSGSVDFDYYQAQTLNIKAVPFFLLNEKYGVSGAQPAEVYTNILQDVYTKSQTEIA